MQDIEAENRRIIGVNHAIMAGEVDIEGQHIDPKIAEMQNEKMAKLRSARNESEVVSALSAITDAAKSDENLFPHILNAVKAYCTVGEIMNAMKDEFGTWMPPSGF